MITNTEGEFFIYELTSHLCTQRKNHNKEENKELMLKVEKDKALYISEEYSDQEYLGKDYLPEN